MKKRCFSTPMKRSRRSALPVPSWLNVALVNSTQRPSSSATHCGPKSDASKTEGEITAAKRFYQNADLRNAVVTGDALHCERENMQLVIGNDGDFLFQLKDNQPIALAEADRIVSGGGFPFLTAKRKIAGTVG
jgi:hypothetical protein